MDREKQLTNYFTVEKPVFKTKGLIYFLIIWLVIAYIFSLIAKETLVFKVLVYAAIAVAAFLRYFRPYFKQLSLYNSRISDKEVDDMFEKALESAINSIIKKEGIDEDDEDELKAPTFISCYSLDGFNRVGFDGKKRWAIWKIQMLFFREDSALYYEGEYGHISEELLNEHTHRVFYKDIISPKVTRESGNTKLELTGTDIVIYHYPDEYATHGKNRTSDINFLIKALEKMMYSTKYKTVN